jgi:UrcA family protein
MKTSATSRAFSPSMTTLAACVLLGACAVARAEAPCSESKAASTAAPAVTVTYHDLDLATPQGSSALYGRISEAAHKVCAAGDIRDLNTVAASHACEREAVSRAVTQVHGALMAARG